MAEMRSMFFTPCSTAKSAVHCNCVAVRSSTKVREKRLDLYQLIFIIMHTTNNEKCVCLACQSMNCVTHHYPEGLYGEDVELGECLDCGSYEVVYEDSPSWNEMVIRGLLHV